VRVESPTVPNTLVVSRSANLGGCLPGGFRGRKSRECSDVSAALSSVQTQNVAAPLISSEPLQHCLEKFSQPRGICAKLVPSHAKLLRAVLAVFPGAQRVDIALGDHVVDAPCPILSSVNPD
jgi:hypothetical protein